MKKIDFNELKSLVCGIDYLDSDSYPVVFSIITKETDNIETFEAGIGDWAGADNNIILDSIINKAFGTQTELQYLAKIDDVSGNKETCCYLDLQDPDCMESQEIEEMLKEKCHIDEYNSDKLIVLHQKDSFSSIEKSIFDYQLSGLVVDKLKEMIGWS